MAKRTGVWGCCYEFVGVLALALLWPANALGYCLERTCEAEPCFSDDCPQSDCERDESGCVSEGPALSYVDGCLTFAVERGAGKSLGVDDAELHDVVWEAFERWRFVDCGGGRTPSFSIQSAGIVPANGKFFCEEEPTLNLGVWRAATPCDGSTAPCWRHEADSLGYTTLTYSPDTGIIADADVELSVERIDELQAPAADRRALLVAVATHEAGHVLGIGHSDNQEAIMDARYSLDRLLGYTFTADDIAAICSVFPPTDERLSCPSPTVDDASWDATACAEAAAVTQNTSEPACELTSFGSSPAWAHGFLAGLSLACLGARRRSRNR